VINKQYAGFGAVTWELTDQLSLDGGIRVTHQKKDYHFGRFAFDGGRIEVIEINENAEARLRITSDLQADYRQWFYFRAVGQPNARHTFKIENAGDCDSPDAWNDYRAVASYKITPRIMAYATASKGFRPGGANNIPPFDSTEDLAFNHEAELSASGKSLIATDERGGGVLPPGASCAPGVDNTDGNGGVHFYRANAVVPGGPGTAAEEQKAYALTSEGDKAIFRAPVRTQPRGTVCTAHVFHQIPGENRIFMAWYSQGTQVIDFVENPDGTVDFKQAGWFVPENANEWSSAIFKTEKNADGTTTYYGATGDFALGEAGRNSIDVYKVTLPPAPLAAAPGGGGGGGGDGGGGAASGACAQPLGGTKAADNLLGSIAGDRIKGRGGDDTLDGRDGDDCVNGGGGADRVKGAAGADKLVGGRGRDRLVGGPDADVLRTARGGRDRVSCGKGKDKAIVDARDKTRGCERVKVRGSRR